METERPASGICPSCGAAGMRRYCPACGERARSPGDLTVRAWLGGFVAGAVDLDGRFWRTLATLLRRPGGLTADAKMGVRRPYLRPIQLFLFCNLVYFFAQPLTGASTLVNSYESHLNDQIYSAYARDLVAERLAATGEDKRAFQERVGARLKTQSRALVAVLLPALALLLAVVTLPRGGAIGVALLLATEFLCFFMTVVLVALALLFRLLVFELGLYRMLPTGSYELFLTVSMLLPTWLWVTSALYRAYGFGWLQAGLRAGAFTLLLLLPVFAFRLIVFLSAVVLP